MNEMSFDCHGISLFMRLGVIFFGLGFIAFLDFGVSVELQDDLFLRVVWILKKDLHIHL